MLRIFKRSSHKNTMSKESEVVFCAKYLTMALDK